MHRHNRRPTDRRPSYPHQAEGAALQLDRSSLQLLLKGFLRQVRGQAAARALIWGEEAHGVKTDLDLYNL